MCRAALLAWSVCWVPQNSCFPRLNALPSMPISLSGYATPGMHEGLLWPLAACIPLLHCTGGMDMCPAAGKQQQLSLPAVRHAMMAR